MVEKKKSNATSQQFKVKDDSVDLLSFNKGMKQQKIHDLQDKVEHAKHSERPLEILAEPSAVFQDNANLQVQIDNLQSEIKKRDDTIKVLRSEIHTYKTREDKNSKDMKELKDSMAKSEREFKNQSQQLDSQKNKVKELENQISDLKKVKQEKDSLQKQLAQTKLQLKEVENLQREVQKRDTIIGDLKKELSDLKQKHDADIKKAKDDGLKIKELQDKISKLNSEFAQAKNLKDSNDTKIQEYELQLKKLNSSHSAELNKLNMELKKVKSDNAQLSDHEEKALRPLQNKILELQKVKYQYEQRMKELESSLKDSRQQLSKIEEKDKSIQKLKEQLGQNREYKDREINKLKREIMTRDDQIMDLEQALLQQASTMQNNILVIQESVIPSQDSQQLPSLPQQQQQQQKKFASPVNQERKESKDQPSQQQKQRRQSPALINLDFWKSFISQFGFFEMFRRYVTSWISLSDWNLWFQGWMSSWFLISLISMMGPPGAYVASRYMLKRSERAMGQALWMLVPLVNFFVWLDMSMVAWGRVGKRKTNVLPMVNKLPFMGVSGSAPAKKPELRQQENGYQQNFRQRPSQQNQQQRNRRDNQ